MILRADHIAGAAFVIFGFGIIALSGDLPVGGLSMPGAGFLPRIVAVLTILLGGVLALRGGESPPFADIEWTDLSHAASVVVIAAAAIGLYVGLGFVITLVLMMTTLLIVIERRHPLRAAGYSAAVVLATYVTFEYLLKTPLPDGPLGF